MSRGRVHSGDFRRGNVVNWSPDPAHFGNIVNWTPSPAEFGNPNPPTSDNENKVTWAPSPAHYGNSVGGVPVVPTFDPVAGTYGVPQLIHIISAGADRIYFTIDGTPATTLSRLYEGSVFIPSTMTVNAIAVIDDISSADGSAVYTITNPAP